MLFVYYLSLFLNISGLILFPSFYLFIFSFLYPVWLVWNRYENRLFGYEMAMGSPLITPPRMLLNYYISIIYILILVLGFHSSNKSPSQSSFWFLRVSILQTTSHQRFHKGKIFTHLHNSKVEVCQITTSRCHSLHHRTSAASCLSKHMTTSSPSWPSILPRPTRVSYS